MTRSQFYVLWDGAAQRERDALVAEHVMGWTRYPKQMHPTDNRTIGGVLFCPPDLPSDLGRVNVVPDYSTEIAADYEVHKVASHWIFSKRQAYFKALNEIIQKRAVGGDSNRRYEVAWPDAIAYLEPGDFSHAALIAVMVS